MLKYNIIWNFIFKFHYFGMIIIPFSWIFSKYILLLHFIILTSWKINDNKCIISQIEYYYTGRTFMGKGKKYFVPKIHRYILYGNFMVGNSYYLFL